MRDDRRVPRLAADRDPGTIARNPAEGYLLSRIDGQTPWLILCEVGGPNPDEVDSHLERWIREGALVFRDDPASGSVAVAAADGGSVSDRSRGLPADPEIDPGLEIPVERQREILEMEARLDVSYPDLLGVAVDADARTVKRAYFALSKKFHPDRYFGREIGEFEPRLTRIFHKLVEAAELLSDPAASTQRQAQVEASEPPEFRANPPEQGQGDLGDRTQRRREQLEILRRRLKPAEKVRQQRRFQGVQLFETAKLAIARENWGEAASCLRLAIVFDPRNPKYLERLPEILARANLLAVEEMLETDSLDTDALRGALQLCEEALAHRPRDAEANHRAAGLALELGERDTALEYAQAARALDPDRGDFETTRGRILRASGLAERAKEAFEHALSLDPANHRAQMELNKLGRADRERHREGESWVT